MRFFIGSLFFSLLICTAKAQSLFQPYDCRPEVEIINRIEVEKRLREQAYRDSVHEAQHQLVMLQREAYKKYWLEDTLNGWKTWKINENYAFGKDRGSLPMIAELQALHPVFRDKVVQLIERCAQKGIELALVETYRTHSKQAEYKGMGKAYTRKGAGRSKHQYGLAVDVVPVVNGEPQWENKALWRKIGITGEQLGLRWGGRWRHPYDPGHFEWTGGMPPSQLAQGKLYHPKLIELYPCIEADLRMLNRYWENWEAEQASLANNTTPTQ
ncbi:MAG: M15 family metallopeptidase [Cyclobacteriaceae bacterium]|nr:M15 family metallopeptidase [Cyclobacteriaceae bacterium]